MRKGTRLIINVIMTTGLVVIVAGGFAGWARLARSPDWDVRNATHPGRDDYNGHGRGPVLARSHLD